MSDPWTFSGKVAGLGQSGGAVTLVDESTFTISGREGDVVTLGTDSGFMMQAARPLSTPFRTWRILNEPS